MLAPVATDGTPEGHDSWQGTPSWPGEAKAPQHQAAECAAHSWSPSHTGGLAGVGGRGKGSQSQLEGCPWSPCHLEGRECTSVRQDNCTGPDLDRRKLVGGVCPHKVSSPLKHWDSHCQQFHPGPGVHSPSGTGHLDPRQLWELRVASREQAEAGPAASPALSCRQRSQHPRPTARTGYQSLDA